MVSDEGLAPFADRISHAWLGIPGKTVLGVTALPFHLSKSLLLQSRGELPFRVMAMVACVTRRVSFWAVATLFATCLGLTAEILRLRKELAAVRSESVQTAVEISRQRKEIVDLRRKLTTKNRLDLTSRAESPVQPRREVRRLPPGIEAVVERQMHHQIMRLYGAGIDALRLPPNKKAKLKSLLNEMALSQKDTGEILDAAGVGPDTATFAEALNQTRSSIEDEIKALVGSDGWATLEASAKLAGFDEMVKNDYAYDFDDAGSPLSSNQELVLAQSLAASMTSGAASTGGPGYLTPDAMSGLTPANQMVLASAAGSLSADQLHVLKNIFQQENRELGSAGMLTGGTSVTISVVSDATTLRQQASPDHSNGLPK